MKKRRDGNKIQSRVVSSRKDNILKKNSRLGKNTKTGTNARLEKQINKSFSLIKGIIRSISNLWKWATERSSPSILIGGVIILVVVMGIALSLGGKKSAEVAEVSAGQKDNINGFMFIFDRRSVQQQLVDDMKKGLVPLKLICEKIELSYEDDGTVSENIDESATIVTDDSDFITRVYQEMTDMIVIGQTAMRDNKTRCRLTMVLQDGTDCIFNFDTVSIIEIEGQDYMMESDGELWKLLPGFF